MNDLAAGAINGTRRIETIVYSEYRIGIVVFLLIQNKAIPSWVWCKAAIIGLVGSGVFIVCRGVKYIIDVIDKSQTDGELQRQRKIQ